MSEFFVQIPVAKLSTRAQPYMVDSNASERAGLAARFALISIDSLAATLDVWRTAEGARVTGRLQAQVVQRCVISGEPLAAKLEAEVAVDFVQFDSTGGDEVELSADVLDTMGIENERIDLGEAVAQSLLLVLDPYPRAPDPVLEAARALLLSEEEAAQQEASAKAAASPFAVLGKKPG